MATKTKPVVVMCVKGKNILLRALNTKRIVGHGFGLFVEEIKKGEILVDQATLDAVLDGEYWSGLCPMEIFDGNIIGFCDGSIPIKKLSVHSQEAKAWFRECCVVDDEEALKQLYKEKEDKK